MSKSSEQATECFKTVLVATDGSNSCAGAVSVAIDMAVRMRARLLALSILVPDETSYEAPPAAERRVTAIVGEVVASAKALGVDVEGRVMRGVSHAEAIVAAAVKESADVIVMGRPSRKGLAEKMLGDATSKIIASADVPVLVVPKDSKPWRNRILFATDGSGAAERAADYAAKLGHCCNMPLTVLSVESPKHSPERQAEAARIVERTVAAFASRGLDAEGAVRRGAPVDEIIRAIEDCKADLIVVGSEGRTALSRLLVGSNSLALIGRAERPVLVARAPGK